MLNSKIGIFWDAVDKAMDELNTVKILIDLSDHEHLLISYHNYPNSEHLKGKLSMRITGNEMYAKYSHQISKQLSNMLKDKIDSMSETVSILDSLFAEEKDA